jgi:hypothetical protein
MKLHGQGCNICRPTWRATTFVLSSPEHGALGRVAGLYACLPFPCTLVRLQSHMTLKIPD